MSYNKSFNNTDGTASGGLCLIVVVILLINLTIGGLCFNYSLNSCFGKTANFWIAGVCGLFLGEVTIPAAIICFVVSDLAGISTPFFGSG